ncbi:MAG: NAD-glutamate dehydrogenase [Acidothermales bacterium]|nr:NAD-glutamate dehydrogenase [Acidothermales bacterium]
MLSKLEDAKADLLDKSAEVGEHTPGAGGRAEQDVAGLLRRYYRHVAAEDLLKRDPVDIYGAAMSHRQLAEKRPQGSPAVRVFTPTVDHHGWTTGHTVVEMVIDDMPFLVDSVSMELSRQDRAIHLVVHPQMVVRRSFTGELIEVCSGSADDNDDAVVESWIHVEIDRESDRAELDRLAGDLQRVLHDVRGAVEDWQKMRQAALDVAEELASTPPPLPAEEVSEAEELLRWLVDEHFTFLGYREYVLEQDDDGQDLLRALPGTGLGILRSDKPAAGGQQPLSDAVSAKARERRLLVLTKANSRATVHRPSYLDYIGVKRFDEAGNPVSERRFLGLFSHTAYNESISRIPVLRRKTAEVLERAGFPPNSHSGKDLQQILETYPRDELFQTSVDDLLPIARSVLYLQERRQLRLFLRKDDYGRFMSCLVYLPRERYTTQMRLKMQEILQQQLGGATIDYTAQISESVLARVHFVVRMAQDQPLPDVDAAEVEEKLVEAIRTWADDFGDAVLDQCGEESAARLAKRYAQAFPEAYKEDFPARTAVADLLRLEALRGDGALGMNLYEPFGARQGERRFKLYRIGGAVSLTHVLPRLQDMGVEVVDERPYEVTPLDGPSAWVYDFGLRYDTDQAAPDSVKEQFQEAFAAVWRGDAESDGFNALVLRAGLSWRQSMVLRAYAKYLRQAGTTFSQEYIEQALVGHVHIARLLVRLFEALLDPTRQAENGDEVAEALVEEINGALDDVASLDQDRILRAYLRLIQATLRTNYFQRDDAGALMPYLSVKFDPQVIPELPQPRPRFEIWVYSPLVEGVHLRFGPVARGGLRWSDRREDFRTEVLGLVKAQAVKNAVIVPVGAKGGFVVKQPQADPTDREAVQAEGISRYKTFISGMLDITDNLRTEGGKRTVLPPEGVVRRDGDDPYLVVAADKGTATFSDIANSVAKDYGYWLGDAFASGGSAGYDHKAMGITARGAWESVKRHFREMGRDIQQEDFTVVGVGDMSGDVFGNGMLLSRHIRLLAAFDHRHIFLDPDPDAETSFKERERLFALPRSSWADYNSSLISAGGGVLSRTAKSLKITPEVRAALGLPEGTTSMTPAELMRGIISAPVDLFWNGGIGTYVKATTESNAEVGDKANDAIRVNGSDLRCKAVGEGGNLGMTQLGRIEYARHDGAVNTDAIDNSAGVDTSDHEVNIKILLDRVVRDGDLTEKQRDTLLAEMTDEVGQLVLKDNYGQNVAIATALVQGPAMLHIHARYMRDLEDSGHLNRELEFLPDDTELAARQAAGEGLTGPEFSVLLAYTKIWLAEQLLDSSLPEDPYLRNELYRYFPTPLRERFAAQMDEHPLRREIIATGVVNNFVNNAGTTFYFRIAEETGASAQEIARAHTVARMVYDLQGVWEGVEALDCEVDATVQAVMRLEARKLSERATRWLLANRRPPLDIAATIDTFAEGVRDLSTALPDLLRGSDHSAMQRRLDELVAAGVPEELARRVASMAPSLAALDIVEVAAASGQSVEDVGRVYFDLAERLRLTRLLDRILALPRDDRWKALARAALRDDLYAAHASLTADVLEASDDDTASAADRFAEWESTHEAAVTRAMSMLDQISAAETFDLATLSVALRVIRSLLRTRSAA